MEEIKRQTAENCIQQEGTDNETSCTLPDEEKTEQQPGAPDEPPVFSFPITLNAGELWKFSMYHANRGYLGIFNGLFTIAALYLLVTQWAVVSGPYRMLLILCVLMFTVWQPGSLYLKAKRQAKVPAVREPMILSFGNSGVTVEQSGQIGTIPWQAMNQIVGNKWQFILYKDRIHAFLLPKSVVGSKEADLRAFLKEKMPRRRCKHI